MEDLQVVVGIGRLRHGDLDMAVRRTGGRDDHGSKGEHSLFLLRSHLGQPMAHRFAATERPHRNPQRPTRFDPTDKAGRNRCRGCIPVAGHLLDCSEHHREGPAPVHGVRRLVVGVGNHAPILAAFRLKRQGVLEGSDGRKVAGAAPPCARLPGTADTADPSPAPTLFACLVRLVLRSGLCFGPARASVPFVPRSGPTFPVAACRFETRPPQTCGEVTLGMTHTSSHGAGDWSGDGG